MRLVRSRCSNINSKRVGCHPYQHNTFDTPSSCHPDDMYQMKDTVKKVAQESVARWGWTDLPLGLLFMIMSSVLVHVAVNPDALESRHFLVTITVAIAAHLGGYLAYRRFDIFPGMAAAGALFPTFILAYSAAIVAILLLRLEYSRLQIITSFAASVSWYSVLVNLRHHLRAYKLAIVPGGQISKLDILPGISWSHLSSPSHLPRQFHGIVVDLSADLSSAWERFIADCALSGVPVYHVKQVVESLTGRVQIAHLSENTLGSLNPNQFFINLKKVIDWASATLVLVAISPFLALIAVAIRIDSPGPALFRQPRMGYRGRIFTVYKFRTMRVVEEPNEGDETQNAMTKHADDRVTRIGSFLRRTRIDELPQVLNIIRGEMSWIGPRPEALPLSRWYENELPFYRYRHIVRPGITGWAQVNQGHVTDLHEVLDKLHYDFYYIKNISCWLDIAIIYRTLVIILTGFGAK